MASANKSWHNRVFIAPRHTFKVKKNGVMTPMHILNNGPVRLAFKLKSTRNQSLKPSVSTGFLAANGGCVHLFFVYKPQPRDKPLNATDRLTILMTTAAEGVMNWESCSGGKEQQCVRYVIRLRQEGASEESEGDTETAEEEDEK